MVTKALSLTVFAHLRNATDRRTDSFTIALLDLVLRAIAFASGFDNAQAKISVRFSSAMAAVLFVVRQVAGNVYCGLMHKI